MANIIRPHREVLLSAPSAGVSGHFIVELIHAATGAVTRRLEFRNIITDACLDALLNTNGQGGSRGVQALFSELAVGTGSATPAATDLALGAQIASTAFDGGFPNSTTIGAAGAYHGVVVTREFTQAQANGNLTELGFIAGPTGSKVTMNRQLFRDTLGAPAVVTKTAAESLRITFEFRMYPPTGTVVDNVNIGADPFTITTSAVAVTQARAWNVLILGDHWNEGANALAHIGYARTQNTVPSDMSSVTNIGQTTYGYTLPRGAGEAYRTLEQVFDPNTGNDAAGIGSFLWSTAWDFANYAQFASTLDHQLYKTNVQRLTMRWKFGIARH
jgi:hypothetical protein